MSDPLARHQLIEAIVRIAIERIDKAGCRTRDFIATIYYNLLWELGETEAATKVKQHYQERGGRVGPNARR